MPLQISEEDGVSISKLARSLLYQYTIIRPENKQKSFNRIDQEVLLLLGFLNQIRLSFCTDLCWNKITKETERIYLQDLSEKEFQFKNEYE